MKTLLIAEGGSIQVTALTKLSEKIVQFYQNKNPVNYGYRMFNLVISLEASYVSHSLARL